MASFRNAEKIKTCCHEYFRVTDSLQFRLGQFVEIGARMDTMTKHWIMKDLRDLDFEFYKSDWTFDFSKISFSKISCESNPAALVSLAEERKAQNIVI